MRILSALAVVLTAATAPAATFVGEAWMEFTAANGTLPRVPVEVRMTTDYSTLSWDLLWDAEEMTVIGGPDENFETSFGTSGRIQLRDPVVLGFPNAAGVVTGGGGSYDVSDGDFFGTSRVVTREESWQSAPEDFARFGSFGSHSLDVADYPEALRLTIATDGFILAQTTTTDGRTATLQGKVYRNETGSALGIDSLFTEVLPGDFNSDAQVDAADYTVGRDAEFPLTGLLANLDTWEGNYGDSSEPEATPIPEPTTATLLILAAMATGTRRSVRG